MSEEAAGILPRRINRAEVRQMITQTIKDNLALGARHVVETTAFLIKNGWPEPMLLATPENLALYATVSQKYGLAHHGGITQEGGVNPDLYFDPQQLPAEVRRVVRGNLASGMAAIQEWHLRSVREGDTQLIQHRERMIDQYTRIAQEHDAPVNPQEQQELIIAHVTAENLQAGVVARTKALQEALRKANYFGNFGGKKNGGIPSICSGEGIWKKGGFFGFRSIS